MSSPEHLVDRRTILDRVGLSGLERVGLSSLERVGLSGLEKVGLCGLQRMGLSGYVSSDSSVHSRDQAGSR